MGVAERSTNAATSGLNALKLCRPFPAVPFPHAFQKASLMVWTRHASPFDVYLDGKEKMLIKAGYFSGRDQFIKAGPGLGL
uniref:Uncharacterized protein n=1 Tax=Magnetospirillum gryphiswaldense TaxID=55518 RepID=A4U3W1_9PROT|nr:hypothetical protein MGR_1617 [Magnetospirillum gryphiswaldense MSR-1]